MRNKISIAKWTLTVVSTMSLMVACGKKDDGGGSRTPEVNVCANIANGQTASNGWVCQNGVAVNPCLNVANNQVGTNGQICQNGAPVVTGQIGTGTLLSNVQFDSSYIRGIININGNLNNNNGNQNNQNNYAVYAGPVSITGSLQVLQQMCGAPVGNYTFTNNAQSAQFYMGVLSNVTLTARGPTTIQLNGSWMTSQIYASGTRIGLNVQVIVNGNPCGAISTY